MKTFKQFITESSFDVKYYDENENAIVHDDGQHRISVNKPNNSSRAVLWKKTTIKDRDYWKKSGELQTTEKYKNFGDGHKTYLAVSHVEIDKDLRGNGLGKKLYQAMMHHSGDHISGIISYTPNRVNKKQVPKIYDKMGAETFGDYQVIKKKS